MSRGANGSSRSGCHITPNSAPVCVAHGFDDSVLGKRERLQWRSCLCGAKIVVAIYLRKRPIDRNDLAGGDVAGDTLESDSVAVLDHLHPPAHPENGERPVFRNIDQRIFCGIAFGRIAAVGQEVVAAGEKNAGNGHGIAKPPNRLRVIGYRYWR